MSNYIEVETTRMEQDRSSLESELKQVMQEMASLREEVEAMSGMWEGTAHDTFLTQFNNDYEYIQEFCKEVTEYIEAMRQATQIYNTCENEIEGIISAIPI